MLSPKYLIDTNVILDRTTYRNYDETVFSIYWKNFDKLVDEGIIISVPAVKMEINNLVHKGETGDEILNWVENNSTMFKLPFDNNKYDDTKNLIKNKLQGWFSRKKENNLWADRDLVVFAKAFDLIIVTQETPNFNQTKQKKFKIPTVCKELGAYCRCGLEVTSDINPDYTNFQCINFVELVRREELWKCSVEF